MLEYERIYQLAREAWDTNGWVILTFNYAWHFLLGAVSAKLALHFSEALGAILSVLAVVALYEWYDRGAGAFFFFAYPGAWTSWGVLAVCGQRFYSRWERGR